MSKLEPLIDVCAKARNNREIYGRYFECLVVSIISGLGFTVKPVAGGDDIAYLDNKPTIYLEVTLNEEWKYSRLGDIRNNAEKLGCIPPIITPSISQKFAIEATGKGVSTISASSLIKLARLVERGKLSTELARKVFSDPMLGCRDPWINMLVEKELPEPSYELATKPIPEFNVPEPLIKLRPLVNEIVQKLNKYPDCKIKPTPKAILCYRDYVHKYEELGRIANPESPCGQRLSPSHT